MSISIWRLAAASGILWVTMGWAGMALAAHPAIEACGGFSANRSEGVQNARWLSRAEERKIESFLQRADATPGVSIAVVRGDEIIYARGFGYRDLSGCATATSKTRYYLKSTTKNFLGAAAAVLHEEGAIELDAPISDYLPDLKLPDGLRAEQVSIRAHLTHTQPYFDAGLNYRTAFPGNLPEEDFIDHVNTFSVTKDIRFRYSNFGPIMAAHAIGAKTGVNWRELIAEKVFAPAGMNDSFTVMTEAEKGEMAQGYMGGFEKAYTPELTKIDSQMHAAGGAVSTVSDMARWIIINLNHGEINGVQVLPHRAIEQTHARQTQLKASFEDYQRFAYGLGLYSADYEGDLLMHHFGGETHMSFMPERGLGVVILTNELDNGVWVTHALASTIYDMLLGKNDIDARIERRLAGIAEGKTRVANRLDQYLAMVREQAPEGPPTLSEEEIIGAYGNKRLGDLSILERDGALAVDYGAIKGALTHVSGDLYLADIGLWNTMPPQRFTFRMDEALGFILDWDGRIFERID
jgi:CubicO group peptidase (beta-lactamase class C family)